MESFFHPSQLPNLLPETSLDDLAGDDFWDAVDPLADPSKIRTEADFRRDESLASLQRLREQLGDEDFQEIVSGPQPKQYVRLGQMAAIVQRGKRTLEREKTKGELPPPTIEGGGGKPDEWEWSIIRPWLETKYGRCLPARFPDLTFPT